jgi:hypothetical protein
MPVAYTCSTLPCALNDGAAVAALLKKTSASAIAVIPQTIARNCGRAAKQIRALEVTWIGTARRRKVPPLFIPWCSRRLLSHEVPTASQPIV